jgi:hypothetical protein
MKRFLIFFLLGPLIGAWTLLFLNPEPVGALARAYEASVGMVRGLPLAYMLGIMPALPTAGVDYLLRNYRWRLFYVAFVGSLSSVGFFPAWRFAIAGLIAAILCSYLTNRSSKGAPLLPSHR